ncbi:hypothetical protein [Agromyces atrinae]|uniref:Uncharacterized protein n=1 Tax=Agromyces atrinae TaxID=592376 RepID=A0A4Q2M1P6_9MICO|nr:hypothetical protein [Agromyces atrinae]NYD68280.1 hypothetical protein [Agromyces atrinae]RXZ85659.1 hypothetical protein ESP50_14320 [Agromyces atrinae]
MPDLPSPLPRYYYLSWIEGEHNHDEGLKLAKSLAGRHERQLTVIRASKNHLEPIFKGIDVVTTRSGGPLHGRFVAALYPDVRDMTRFFADDLQFMVIDWAGNPSRGWAEIHGAYDLREGRYLEDERPDEVREIHEHLDFSGYNGYTSPPGSYTVKGDLDELYEHGWLDERGKDYLMAAMLANHSDGSLADLRNLADKINPKPPRD